MATIKFEYDPEDEFHGRIYLGINSTNFRGGGYSWINISQISEFSSSLRMVLSQEKPDAIISGGIWCDEVLVDAQVYLRILPHNLTGVLRLECLVARNIPRWEVDVASKLEAYFFSTHNDILKFSRDIAEIVRSGVGGATIEVFESPDYSQ
ncbi:hypothetical protein [Allorhizobium undicola]|uniref:hypothetical protein n=1 Tax=Allorhizobium undicola TaxID=78527 RepID=UPI0012B661A6|nr:hypothetical protein [Allorhizobium undicola]